MPVIVILASPALLHIMWWCCDVLEIRFYTALCTASKGGVLCANGCNVLVYLGAVVRMEESERWRGINDLHCANGPPLRSVMARVGLQMCHLYAFPGVIVYIYVLRTWKLNSSISVFLSPPDR